MNLRGQKALKKAILVLLCVSVLIIVVAEKIDARSYFALERPRLGFRFRYEFESEKRTSPTQDRDDIMHVFRESLSISTTGWVYHPYLLHFRLSFAPELKQRLQEQTRDNETDSDTTYDIFTAYDVEATFLEKKPYTLDLFGHRDESSVRTAFSERTERRSDRYGGRFSLKYPVLPVVLGYTHLDAKETGFFSSRLDNDTYSFTANKGTKNTRTVMNASYSDTNRTSSGGSKSETKNTNVDFRNNFKVTADGRVNLRSYALYRRAESTQSNQTRDRDDRFFTVSGDLDWQHRENLRSSYTIDYDRKDSEDFDSERTIVSASLSHRLYENLDTSLLGRASHEDFTGGKRDSYAGSLDFHYRRRIPWGKLGIRVGHSYDYTERETDQDPIEVLDESHVLQDGVVTQLDNPNVILNTIVVTDVTNTIIYVEDQDYTIEVDDSFVRIIRTTFGSIQDGQRVLVDYVFIPDPPFDDGVLGQRYGIDLSLWSVLTLNYNFLRRDQNILSGPTPTNTIDDTVHTAQMRLDWRWTETKLTFEDEDRSSGISSRAWTARETLRFRPARQTSLSFSGFYGRREFFDRDQTEENYTIEGDIGWSPRRQLRLSVRGFGGINSGTSQDTEKIGASANVDWAFRIWRGRIRYTFSDENDKLNQDRRKIHYLLFEAIRIPF
jgi:hypothetical protein